MADKMDSASEIQAKPWNGNYEAERDWALATSKADHAALDAGACKFDLVLAHLRVAADIKGVGVWDFVQSLTPEERAAIAK